ncbi:hypothetical protein [Amycolatopsis magusensis]
MRSYSRQYTALVFVIYDIAGAVRDAAEFRRDLEPATGVKVLVIKH